MFLCTTCTLVIIHVFKLLVTVLCIDVSKRNEEQMAMKKHKGGKHVQLYEINEHMVEKEADMERGMCI